MTAVPFACPTCGRTFGTRKGVKAHKREVHPTDNARRSRDAHRKKIAAIPAAPWENA